MQRLFSALATAQLNNATPWVKSVLLITIAASQMSAATTANANRAPRMVKLVTSAFAAVSSTTLALTGYNAAKKLILVAVVS